MVVGSGMIAKRFNSYSSNEEVIIFASGVSNSSGAVAADYEREQVLLQNTLQQFSGKMLVYFSTCSIYDPSLSSSAYAKHKLMMERLICDGATSYIIFRVSNPVGYTNNTHTVLNFFVDHITKNRPFEIWKNAGRNLIDVDDMFAICDHFIGSSKYRNAIHNVANPVNYPVPVIIEAIEKHFNCKGNYTIIEKGNSPQINTTELQLLFKELSLEFNSSYLSRLLHKYFPTAK